MSHPFEKTWWIDGGKILGGRYPGDRSIEVQKQCLNALLDHGITRFVNLQQVDDRGHGGEPFRDYMPLVEPIARSRSISVGFARFPIRDVSIPDLPTALAAINHLDDLIHAGQTPYVHCFGGNGRTGTIIGCWLVRHGRTPEQAFEEMQRGRIGRGFTYEAPETSQQRAFVRAWPMHDR